MNVVHAQYPHGKNAAKMVTFATATSWRHHHDPRVSVTTPLRVRSTYGIVSPMGLPVRLWRSYRVPSAFMEFLKQPWRGKPNFHYPTCFSLATCYKHARFKVHTSSRVCRVNHHGRRYPELANTTTICLLCSCSSRQIMMLQL